MFTISLAKFVVQNTVSMLRYNLQADRFSFSSSLINSFVFIKDPNIVLKF
jgi:hypothetical protein